MAFDYGSKLSDGQYERHPTKDTTKENFIRPVRLSYIHVGLPGPKNKLRDLTTEEQEQYKQYNYVKFEEYDESQLPCLGRFWTQKELDSVDKGCHGITKMPLKIAETYASDPSFYGKTFCAICGDYFPVGKNGEFVWVDNDGKVTVTTNERVGT